VLESILARRVEAFAFPYADSRVNKQEVIRMLRKIGYQAACLYGGGPIPLPITDPYHLARLAMGWNSGQKFLLSQVNLLD